MEDGDGERLVFELAAPWAEEAATPAAVAPADSAEPSWLRSPAPSEARDETGLKPSLALDEGTAGLSPRPDRLSAAPERGRLIHRLLQHLPRVPPGERIERAMAFLASAAPAMIDDHAAILREALAVLDHRGFAPLFAAGSLAEVPIAGRVAIDGGPARLVTGRIDRLAFDGEDVLIADFKTGLAPPSGSEPAPDHVLQLALYRAVVAKLYPGRVVRAALVFTAGPALVEVAPAAMEAALAAL
jgi:ATP-dependent helicase/nuclease subunit A